LILASPYIHLFWSEYQINPSRCDYNIVFDYDISGALNVDLLNDSLQRLVSDKVLINSHLEYIENKLFWKKNNKIISLENLKNNNFCIKSFVEKPFIIDKNPLYRFALVNCGSNCYRFIIVLHHALIDANQFNDFIDLISDYYNQVSIPVYEDSIKNLSETHQLQVNYIDSLKINKSHQLWSNYLRGSNSKNALPYIKSTNLSSEKNTIHFVDFYLSAEMIHNIAEQFNNSIFNVLLLAWGTLMCRYCKDNICHISYPVKIKSINQVALEFGSQVNINIAKIHYKNNETFSDIVHQYQLFLNDLIGSNKRHHYLPSYEILSCSSIKSLNIGFIQSNLKTKPLNLTGCKTKVITENYIDIGGHDLALEYQSEPGCYHFRLKYKPHLFLSDQAESMIKSYKVLLSEVLKFPNKPINKLSIINDDQFKKIIHDFNANRSFFYPNQTISEVFEKQVARTPNNIAIVFENNQLTYSNLNAKANQLSRHLLCHINLAPNTIIALSLNRCLEMIIAILAILKIRATYVPIDIEYPDKRIEYILNDTQSQLLLTHTHLIKRLSPLTSADVIPVDASYTNECADNLNIQGKATDIAYVIYTSGTTGQPKGVMQTHQNVLRLFQATDETFNFNENDVWLLCHSYVFDFSIWELWGALFHGSKAILIKKEEARDSHRLYHICQNQKVTIFNQTPLSFYQFTEAAVTGDNQSLKFRYIIFGGDRLDIQLLKPWFQFQKKHDLCTKLINMYGTTETTVHTTYQEIQAEQSITTIGKPISDVMVYILDDNLFPVPVGVFGGLYIGGAGLSKGYLNKSKITKSRFIQNPFATKKNVKAGHDKFYKTGDLCRYLPDGSIEYIGRNDFQVKIRGFRIELNEIEHALVSIEAITQALVIIKEDSGSSRHKYLVGYFSTRNNIKLEKDSIINKLSKIIPQYMIPSALMQIEEFPLTINGKIDNQALPPVVFQSQEAYQNPTTDTEKFICDAFAKVLNVEKIGINDNFFNLGGNSIKAIELVMLLQKSFEIKVSDIFDHKTPRHISRNIRLTNTTLISKLQQIKFDSTHRSSDKSNISELTKQYFKNIYHSVPASFSTTAINNILLTGATGYLGCNILNQLLEITCYSIYVIVRGKNKEESEQRLNEVFQYYFLRKIEQHYDSRVFVVAGDLSDTHFGLNQKDYHDLFSVVDTVIHAAALVKHYGNKDFFYLHNVSATKNLLNFVKKTKHKHFHYISTCSVAFFNLSKGSDRLFTEYDFPSKDSQWNNVYNQTKYLGEIETIKARKEGIKSSIYRVGNLAVSNHTHSFQKDLKDNAFFKLICFLTRIGVVTEQYRYFQVSQVDSVAQAIAMLFDKRELLNGVYHVFNPKTVDFLKCFKSYQIAAQQVEFNVFIDKIIQYMEKNNNCNLATSFLLHQGWLEGNEMIDKKSITILQSKTEFILNRMNFLWQPINQLVLKKYLTKVKEKNTLR